MPQQIHWSNWHNHSKMFYAWNTALLRETWLTYFVFNFGHRSRNPSLRACHIEHAISGKSIEHRWNSYANWAPDSLATSGRDCGTTQRPWPLKRLSQVSSDADNINFQSTKVSLFPLQAQWTPRTSWPRHKSWRNCATSNWFSCMLSVRSRNPSTLSLNWWSTVPFWNICKVRRKSRSLWTST